MPKEAHEAALLIKRKYPNIPVAGSFSEKKSEAAEYAKMYNYLPHKVNEIEARRRADREREAEI